MWKKIGLILICLLLTLSLVPSGEATWRDSVRIGGEVTTGKWKHHHCDQGGNQDNDDKGNKGDKCDKDD